MSSQGTPDDPINVAVAAIEFVWVRVFAWLFVVVIGAFVGAGPTMESAMDPLISIGVALMQIWGLGVAMVTLGSLWQLVSDSEGFVGWLVLSAASSALLAMAEYEIFWPLVGAGGLLIAAGLYWRSKTVSQSSVA